VRVQFAFAVLSALLLAACSPRAATDITSFVDPSHRKPPFTSVVVACYDATLDEQMIIETEAAKQFAALGVRAFRRMDVVPPTSTLPPEEKAQKLVGTGAAAIVVIRPAGVDIVDTYIPPSYTPPGRYTPGSYSPGYVRSRPIAAISCQ
jgi:hypothetical protein